MKESILSNVGNQTVLVTIDFHYGSHRDISQIMLVWSKKRKDLVGSVFTLLNNNLQMFDYQTMTSNLSADQTSDSQ